ncbi:hypothetical protein CLAIMM_04727 [Cladophialophora immunda]|nr:hypothetical protein CLAIMM_04727 [Cladophialophora immunda]
MTAIMLVNKLNRIASSARKIAANAIKKTHVPAYWPLVFGVQVVEKSGVVEEKKKVIAIESMPAMVEDIGIGELVELPMAMPDVVVDAGIDIDIDIDMALDAGIEIDPIELIVDKVNTDRSEVWVEESVWWICLDVLTEDMYTLSVSSQPSTSTATDVDSFLAAPSQRKLAQRSSFPVLIGCGCRTASFSWERSPHEHVSCNILNQHHRAPQSTATQSRLLPRSSP